jgi:hypothetical protein
MKRIIFLGFLLIITVGLHAQAKKISPAYWVVETNSNKKDFSIVRLYDSSNRLIHEVRMDGYYFDVTRTKDRRKLDLLLKGYFPRAAISSKRRFKDRTLGG